MSNELSSRVARLEARADNHDKQRTEDNDRHSKDIAELQGRWWKGAGILATLVIGAAWKFITEGKMP